MAVLIFCGKLILSTGLLYGYYYLFLRNKRFHHYNRFYLLAAALFSLIIPFINIPVYLFTGNEQHTSLIQTLKVITASGWEEPVIIYARQNQWSKWLSLQNGLYFIYLAGLVTGLIFLIRSILYIAGLKKKYHYETIDQLKIYNTAEPGTPFSFFRSIFWDTTISFNDKQGQQIFRHEMFHVKEKHSADILLMEILCCSCWFNPFFHLIKKELKAIHEFLADEYAVSANNRYEYAELLVLHAINYKAPSVAHPFFHNQIKRRITMITQSNLVRRSGYISRIMALPLLLILVSAFAVKLTSKSSSIPYSHRAGKNITVVIDPGHGGVFPGANIIGMAEKDINLDISQKIKQLAGEYKINVVLTRSNDKLVGNATNLREDLQNRVEISDAAKPDLFISIHVNQNFRANHEVIEKNTDLSGFEAYISRRKETEKARQFASAILGELKNIYATNEIIKQRDEGIMVIDRTAYPSILLECGFINNPKDYAFITNQANQEKIARKILEGIVQYQQSQNNTSAYSPLSVETTIGDTISAEQLSNINLDDIQSITADINKPMATVVLKNGGVKFTDFKKMDIYYSTRRIHNLQDFLAKVTVKNPVMDAIFANEKAGTFDPAKKTDTGENYAALTTNKVNQQDTFTKVEKEAAYPGGNPGWSNYLIKVLKYPDAAVKKKVEGIVIIQFIVDEQGKVSDVKAVSGPELLRAESIRVVKESGTWTSAVNNGKKVKSYRKQPITYKLS